MFYYTTYKSPIGQITLACDKKENLIGLWLEGQKYFLETIGSEIIENDKLEILNATKSWLDRYFKGERPEITELALAPIGNDFRKRVWHILCKIPYGNICTYGDIARIIAKEQGKTKMSAQAVGGAISHNPISIIIPCHRVVGANGNLTDYAGGIENKIALLKLEGINTEKLYISKRSTAL